MFKSIFISMFVFCSVSATELLNCESRNAEFAFVHVNSNNLGRVVYNYSSANIVCAQITDVSHAIENGMNFNCIGLWSFDFKDQKVVDTPVILKFIMNEENGEYEVTFNTSHAYANKKITIDCH